jgi:hypothetical protein
MPGCGCKRSTKVGASFTAAVSSLDPTAAVRWLGDATQLLGLAPNFLVVDSGHKYDWKFEAAIHQLTRQLHTGSIPELNVDNEALRLACRGDAESCMASRGVQ